MSDEKLMEIYNEFKNRNIGKVVSFFSMMSTKDKVRLLIIVDKHGDTDLFLHTLKGRL